MTTTRYRKRPVEIEAVHLNNDTTPAKVAYWCGGRVAPHPEKNYTGGPMVIEIDTLEGTMRAEPGDWIIKGVAGEFYPCKPDIFAETYERVDDDATATGATELETTARVVSALHRSAEDTVTRVITLHEQWVAAGPPPLGAPLARWWDARLAELHNAIQPADHTTEK